jgi:glutathione synthase/RimK-type ligase-like ATP-grasp enzyme
MKPPVPRVLAVTGSPRLLDLPGVAVISADQYLRGELPLVSGEPIIVNLCRSLGYLSRGYYVSLLAKGRGHEAIPSIPVLEAATNPISFLRALDAAGIPTASPQRFRRAGRTQEPAMLSLTTGDGEEARGFREEAGDGTFVLTPSEVETATPIVVLGRTADSRFRALAARVYREFPLPAFQLRLLRDRTWRVCGLSVSAVGRLDAESLRLLAEGIADLASRPEARPPRSRARPLIACLFDPDDPLTPSSRETLDRFASAAQRLGASFTVISRHETHRLAEHDALFVRTLTGLDRWTFGVQQRAQQLGMPVIDDPLSTIRCSNKIYLFEVLQRLGLAQPRGVVATSATPMEAVAALGFPVIVKQPDGSFSQAVKKAVDEAEYRRISAGFFRKSPLLLVQEYLPSEFDWRIGVLGGRVLFAARYHMARGHWQILKPDAQGRPAASGRVDAVARDRLDPALSALAVRAAAAIGSGLYGVDLKEIPSGPVVIEVNDNPNIDEGYEDQAERSRLYEEVIQWFLDRLRSGEEEAAR